MRRLHALAALGAAAAALTLPLSATAASSDERVLAERYAPIVMFVEQTEECGRGEPYDPMDVDDLFGEKTVALRGPWNASDLVKIGPTADDIAGLYEYHLDFPGNALDPGCDFERWSRRIAEGSSPTVYAHVARDPGSRDRIALQYWFFYAFNDFNNTHEGDWEMIQIVFEAPDAATALRQPHPAEVGYSSHEGAERAEWGEDKLDLVDGTHPVVYPAAGSHANKYTAALYLGNSAKAGVGCDDTRGPHRQVEPVVRTIPSDPAAARAAFPWITFEGRWGELQRAFFNGPTGPNMKQQWTAPVGWAESWRARSYAVPTGGVLGTGATDLFCSGVETGSRLLSRLLLSPAATLSVLAAALAIVVFAVVRATWTPVAPLRLARRRTWGQILSASARMYVKRFGLFVGLGLLLIPIAGLVSVVQWLLVAGVDAISSVTGDLAGTLAYLGAVVGATLTFFGFGLVQAATACALRELDAGREVRTLRAYRLALGRFRPLLGAIGIFVAAWVLLTTTVALLPVALWLGVRWSLLAPAVELDRRSGLGALRRSGELVHGRWLRVGSLVGLGGALALAAGPLLGALLIFVSDMPLTLLNVVAGVVYAIALPFVALVTTYVYFDARTRLELEPRDVRSELPAEISVDPV